MKSNAKVRSALPWITLLLAGLSLYLITSQPTLNSNEVSYNEFLSEVRAGHVAEVQIKERTLVRTLKLNQSNAKQPAAARFLSTSRLPGIPDAELVKELEAQHVKYSGSIESGSGWLSTLLI